MKSISYYIALTILITGMVGVNFSMAQTVTKKSMTQLKPNKDLITELKGLMQRVENCDYYSSSLIWNIGITETEKGCILDVSMQSQLNLDYNYAGYFYLDKVLFVVSGFLEEQLFSSLGKESLVFDEPIKNPANIIQSPGEDYSAWIYLWQDERLTLKKEYLLHCD